MYKCEFIGEAMKIKKILLVALLLPVMIFCQEVNQSKNSINVKSLELMSDEDLKSYWAQAQEDGYSLKQIKTIARAQGASESDIAKFEERIGKLNGDGLDSNDDSLKKIQGDISSIFGLEAEEKEVSSDNLKAPDIGVFGSSFFNNPNITSAPNLNVATPASYELGPGDELSISIWGAAENEYTSTISREGYLKIERIGPVYLSGLSVSEAKIKLKNRLSKIYSGINSDYNKVFFDLTLLNSRSIIINIVGNVVAPGTYTLSSLTSPLNALYAAGGPNENGSFREIQVIRGGTKTHSIDLYDYFVRGSLKSFSLRDQDVILVPSYKKRVFLNGEFKTSGIFEVKENESISDLLDYSGGIASFGAKNKVFIQRIDGVYKSANTVNIEDFSDFILNDGDIVEARKVGDEIKNSVSIEGSVITPGQYELDNNPDVYSLIKSAGGLKESALRERAYLIRNVDGFQQEVKTVNLKAAMSFEVEYKLRNNDKLIIASIEELSTKKTVSISGEINSPDTYPFFNGMTVVDLILMGKGITDSGSSSGIIIYRSTYDETQKKPVDAISVNINEDFSDLDEAQNTELQVNDLVVVRSKLGYQAKDYVSVTGLVKKPGNYALKTNTYSFYNLIKDFGGFLPDAELSGVKIIRPIDVDKFEKTQKAFGNDSLVVDVDKFIEIGLNITEILKSDGKIGQHNLVLKNGDEVVVPKYDNSVEVAGAVQQATALSYYKSLSTKMAINNAGGFHQNAKKSAVYVVYQNGSILSTKSFLFFKRYPKLLPGSRIFVPNKAESSSKIGLGEIVGYTTSLVSIIALIKSL